MITAPIILAAGTALIVYFGAIILTVSKVQDWLMDRRRDGVVLIPTLVSIWMIFVLPATVVALIFARR